MKVNWQTVDAEGLSDIVTAARAAGAIAIDTEFMRRNTFYPQVALVQLCCADTAYLLDPLETDDVSALVALLQDPDVVKVMHSPSEDLEVFQRWLGVLPEPLFDTQRAAALLGLGFGLGYRNLVLQTCDVDLPKGETRSNWLQRPLSQSQCDYAAMDVTYLMQVWHSLAAQCRQRQRFNWVLEDGQFALGSVGAGVGAYYRKMKSANKLQARQLAALMLISQWRETTAREKDKPRNWILDDKLCLDLAIRAPKNTRQLQQLDLPPAVARKHGDTLLQLLAQAQKLPDADLPQVLPAPLTPSERDQLKLLKSRTRDIASELGAVPEVLLSAKDFEMLLWQKRGDTVAEPPIWSGWRKQQVLDVLRKEL